MICSQNFGTAVEMVFGNRPLHMKTVILCGGKGTRMKEETEYRPKPLVEIGGKPILWHIMKIYAHYGFNEFVVALGYKGEMIKDYFLKLPAHAGNFTLATRANIITAHGNGDDDLWHSESFSLSKYLVSNFNLRFISRESSSSEDTEIDDVHITGTLN